MYNFYIGFVLLFLQIDAWVLVDGAVVASSKDVSITPDTTPTSSISPFRRNEIETNQTKSVDAKSSTESSAQVLTVNNTRRNNDMCKSSESYLDIISKLLGLLNQSLNHEKLDLKNIHYVIDNVKKWNEEDITDNSMSSNVQKQVQILQDHLHKEVNIEPVLTRRMMSPMNDIGDASVSKKENIDDADNLRHYFNNQENEIFHFRLPSSIKAWNCKDAFKSLIDLTQKAYTKLSNHRICSDSTNTFNDAPNYFNPSNPDYSESHNTPSYLMETKLDNPYGNAYNLFGPPPVSYKTLIGRSNSVPNSKECDSYENGNESNQLKNNSHNSNICHKSPSGFQPPILIPQYKKFNYPDYTQTSLERHSVRNKPYTSDSLTAETSKNYPIFPIQNSVDRYSQTSTSRGENPFAVYNNLKPNGNLFQQKNQQPPQQISNFKMNTQEHVRIEKKTEGMQLEPQYREQSSMNLNKFSNDASSVNMDQQANNHFLNRQSKSTLPYQKQIFQNQFVNNHQLPFFDGQMSQSAAANSQGLSVSKLAQSQSVPRPPLVIPYPYSPQQVNNFEQPQLSHLNNAQMNQPQNVVPIQPSPLNYKPGQQPTQYFPQAQSQQEFNSNVNMPLSYLQQLNQPTNSQRLWNYPTNNLFPYQNRNPWNLQSFQPSPPQQFGQFVDPNTLISSQTPAIQPESDSKFHMQIEQKKTEHTSNACSSQHIKAPIGALLEQPSPWGSNLQPRSIQQNQLTGYFNPSNGMAFSIQQEKNSRANNLNEQQVYPNGISANGQNTINEIDYERRKYIESQPNIHQTLKDATMNAQMKAFQQFQNNKITEQLLGQSYLPSNQDMINQNAMAYENQQMNYGNNIATSLGAQTASEQLYQQRFLNPGFDANFNAQANYNSYTLPHSSQSQTNIASISNSESTDSMMELTFKVNRPVPSVVNPYVFVKYKIPFKSFMSGAKQIVDSEYLRSRPKINSGLLSKDAVIEVSPDLQQYPIDYLNELIVKNGTLTAAKLVNRNGLVLRESDYPDSLLKLVALARDVDIPMYGQEMIQNYQKLNVDSGKPKPGFVYLVSKIKKSNKPNRFRGDSSKLKQVYKKIKDPTNSQSDSMLRHRTQPIFINSQHLNSVLMERFEELKWNAQFRAYMEKIEADKRRKKLKAENAKKLLEAQKAIQAAEKAEEN